MDWIIFYRHKSLKFLLLSLETTTCSKNTSNTPIEKSNSDRKTEKNQSIKNNENVFRMQSGYFSVISCEIASFLVLGFQMEDVGERGMKVGEEEERERPDVMVFRGEGGGERGSDWRGCFTFSAVSCVM